MILWRLEVPVADQAVKERTYNFPVFAAQGGGLVREVEIANRTYEYFFVEVPEGFMFAVGDKMPTEWDIVPANGAAQELISREQFDELDGD
jgi:hypothetical protein